VIPITYQDSPFKPAAPWIVDPKRIPILVVEDSPETVMLYEKYLETAGFQVFAARSPREAEAALRAVRPSAVVLDILVRGEDGWRFLTEIKAREDTKSIPVLIVSTVEDAAKGYALGADAYLVKPVDRQGFVHAVVSLTTPEKLKRILLVDDEEISRYVLRQHLASPEHVLSEAASGAEAIRLARTEPPDAICLDLHMDDASGTEVLRALRADPATREIPVVVVTSKRLEEGERKELLGMASSVLSKDVSREHVLATVRAALTPRGGH
jgi:CheY-like chemotaxis protein